jgi:hypothetical protein
MSKRLGVSAISLVAYDYRFLLATIPSYLDFVDELLVGVDSDRLTMTGTPFEIPASFFEDLQRLDQKPAKIRVISRPFYSPSRSPMENEVAERNALSFETLAQNWIVSIDSDELVLNPRQFFRFLRKQKSDEDVCIEARWITAFKDLGTSVLVIAAGADGALERFPIATRRRGGFVTGRRTQAAAVLSPGLVLHYSWARREDEVRQKLENWSHSRDFDVTKYFEFWKNVHADNYLAVRAFHPIWPTTWSRLVKVEKAQLERIDLRTLGCNLPFSATGLVGRMWRRSLRQWRE